MTGGTEARTFRLGGNRGSRIMIRRLNSKWFTNPRSAKFCLEIRFNRSMSFSFADVEI